MVREDLEQGAEHQRDHVDVLVAVDTKRRPGGKERCKGQQLAFQLLIELGGKFVSLGGEGQPQKPDEGVGKAAVRTDQKRDGRRRGERFALDQIEVDGKLQAGRAELLDRNFQRAVRHDADAVQTAVFLAVADESIAGRGHAVVISVKIDERSFSH